MSSSTTAASDEPLPQDPLLAVSPAPFSSGTRTPRPYHHDGDAITQDPTSSAAAASASDSGTEADDERPSSSFVRALPAPILRPHKGLKIGEASEDVLLTPSQLDDEGRRRGGDYFTAAAALTKRRKSSVVERVREKEEEEAKFQRRRLAEFARRSSEVALVVAMTGVVLCGRGVLGVVGLWRRELLVHVLAVAVLVGLYPVKLSIVDTRATKRRLSERFRVPASFDPATVLYPPFLPVLVALSVSPANPAVVLPNIVLGLTSLPQRLFPRSSRLAGVNSVHWLVSILPVILANSNVFRYTTAGSGFAQALSPETLVSLYPLHHTLLQPLQFLTTTSLLMTELHLLSAALINLLLLASSPQTVILKACLWIGGVTLFLFAAPVLHWNVTLARVPRWKFRRPGHTAEERKSLVDAVTELITLQRTASMFTSSTQAVDSDADEDGPKGSIKPRSNGRLRVSTSAVPSNHRREPQSAVIARDFTVNGSFVPSTTVIGRPRSNTLPGPDFMLSLPRTRGERRTARKSSSLPWCLHLTPEQALLRKWIYAGYMYAASFIIILGPVRWYVGQKALDGQEPIGWALGYLLGQVVPFRPWVEMLGLDDWIHLPLPVSSISPLLITFPSDIPYLRDSFGSANVRLLLLAYWAGILLLGLLAVFSLTAYVEVDTRRKIFHGVMVAMFLPATFVDPCYCALGLAVVLALFLLLETLRAGQVAPLGSAIARFVAPYVDGRDLRGPVVVSHIFLLIGCAVPLWFSLASLPRTSELNTSNPAWPGWDLDTREVAMVSGVICVGLGDAAASLIGRRYGRHKWLWVGGKSLEGSFAFAVAVTVGLLVSKLWLIHGGWWASRDIHESGVSYWSWWLFRAVVCASGASFMEAVLTGANDNVVVPVALWVLVKGARL